RIPPGLDRVGLPIPLADAIIGKHGKPDVSLRIQYGSMAAIAAGAGRKAVVPGSACFGMQAGEIDAFSSPPNLPIRRIHDDPVRRPLRIRDWERSIRGRTWIELQDRRRPPGTLSQPDISLQIEIGFLDP